jgi:hypothetical protein
MSHLIPHLGLLVVSGILFLLPGWILGRLFRSPLPIITAFLGSAAIAFNLVLLLDAFRIPILPGTVALAMLVVSGILALGVIRGRASLAIRRPDIALPTGIEWVWLLPPVLAAVSIAARCLIEPLSGYDNWFRWDYLARLMLERHTLSFYPPVRMEDFDLYSWCDGIPPLAPELNFLIYGAAASASPLTITVRAVAEFGMIALLVARLARLTWGKGAAGPALAALGSCALFAWGLATEQETGLTSIALLAMVLFLEDRDGNPSAVLWAGIAAGVGAISREYGLYFILLGLALLILGNRRRDLLRFALPAACVAAPWYLRNWIKTGNPLFPALGILFPTNAVHVEVMGDIANFMGFRTSPFPLSGIPLTLLTTSGALWLLGAAGALRLRFRNSGILLGIGLVVLLWIWAMPQTAGGWTYAMKALLPALALCAVLSGWLALSDRRTRWFAAGFLALLSVDSARRAWLLPEDPFATPWNLSFDDWRLMKAQSEGLQRHNFWPVLAKAAAGGYIAVDSPQSFMAIREAGGHPTPFESPRVEAAFDPKLTLAEAVARLRALNVRFLTFSVGNPVVNKLVERHPLFRRLAADYAPVANIHGLLIFDLAFLSPKPPAPGAGG